MVLLSFCSSLEDCLTAQGCTGVEVIRKDLEKMADKLQGAQAGEANLRAEVTCLKQRWVTAGVMLEENMKALMEGIMMSTTSIISNIWIDVDYS